MCYILEYIKNTIKPTMISLPDHHMLLINVSDVVVKINVRKIIRFSPMNLALLQHYFIPHEFSRIYDTLDSGKALDINMPYFEFPQHNFF